MNPLDDGIEFPPAETATEDGLLMVGGVLRPNWVLAAYRQGIFPWPIVDQGYELLAWFSPDPRAVIDFDRLYVSRRLARRIRSGRFRVTCNLDFAAVITACAEPRDDDEGTWITAGMVRAYRQLHKLGSAHSIEVWQDETLVGGLYGVSVGGFFAGESMFHRERDASKVALAHLVAHLAARRFTLFDVQQATDHAVSMGAREIPRNDFLHRLAVATAAPISFGQTLDTSLLSKFITR